MAQSSAMKPVVQPGILDIALYQSGASKIAGHKDVLKLSSNENPFGASPKAIAAAQEAAGKLHLYPASDHSALREAIAQVEGLDAERVICGAGSDEIIAFLCQAYAGIGDEVIYTEHGFSMYRISALAAGATPVEVRERNRTTDVDAILEGITERTKLIFIANPNNPTGTMIDMAALERLAEGVPSDVLLVLDGAYAEFPDQYDGGVSLMERYSNVVMTRTFSKIHGLGGLRVGWGYAAQEIIDVLNRVRGPFNVSHIGLAAAQEAILDAGFQKQCKADNKRLRKLLADGMAALGFPSDPSEANFILIRTQDAEEASALDDFFKSQGIIVRRVSGYKLPAALRITVGTDAQVERVLKAVKAFREL